MKRFFSTLFLSLTLMLSVAGVASAQLKGGGDAFTGTSKQVFGSVYDTGGDLRSSLPAAVGSVISTILGFTGVILLAIMVYAGFLWLTAGGNDEQVAHAKKLIQNGVIGMAIALSAFVITSFVVSQLTGALQSGANASNNSSNNSFDSGNGVSAPSDTPAGNDIPANQGGEDLPATPSNAS